MALNDHIDEFELAKKREDAQAKATMLQRQSEDDIRWLMNGKRGRRVLYVWLAEAGVWRSVFNTNAMTMAYAEGMRNWGLNLVNRIMGVCPEKWALMIEENSNADT